MWPAPAVIHYVYCTCTVHGTLVLMSWNEERCHLCHRKLCITVSSSDRSYMPKVIDVEAGNAPSVLRVLKTVNVPGGTHGTVTLLKKQDWHYRHIFIRIKECQHVSWMAMAVLCCVCVWVRACVRVCVHACMCACVCACVHACVGACVHACMRVCVLRHLRITVCMWCYAAHTCAHILCTPCIVG